MARGDYIDEITKISLLLKNNIHRAILKKRLFKISDDKLLSKITTKYISICSLRNEDNILIAILYNSIKSLYTTNRTDRSIKNWTINLLKSLKR